METQTQTVAKIDYKEFGLEEIKANQISDDFKPHFERIIELETEFEQVLLLDINDAMTTFKAKELRQKYVKNRTLGFNETHKKGKDFFLNGGRFCDKIKNSGLAINELKESKLLEIEKYYETQEKAKVEALALLRISALKEFDFDGSAMNLGVMDVNVWDSFLAGTKLQFEAKKAEEKRLALEAIEKENSEIRERARVAEENLKLKKEAESHAKIIAEQKAKADAELAKVESLRKLEQDKSDALLELQRKQSEEKAKKEKAITDAKLKAEKEANEKLQAELKAKQDAEKKANDKIIADKKANDLAELKASKAPEKTQMTTWVNSSTMDPSPVLKDAINQEVAIEILARFAQFKAWANTKIENL